MRVLYLIQEVIGSSVVVLIDHCANGLQVLFEFLLDSINLVISFVKVLVETALGLRYLIFTSRHLLPNYQHFKLSNSFIEVRQ